MELPNIHFQDFPIEFKEINPEDFQHSEMTRDGIINKGFNVEEKIIIEPNIDGYITDNLIPKISLETKNTVIINAAVGQGKTHSIIKIARKYYFDTKQEYVIFIASPFVSLVEQYFNDIVCDGISKEDVYRYEYIGEKPNIKYLDKKIHIITVNTLLGNPGEDAFLNSDEKRKYLNELAKHCKENNKKVVFIYDEIHDAIHNFKEEYIFNLWKWKTVIHKNFIISATFNEASKIVIEYLAELTESKIQIIESKRTRIPKNQSSLHLHYNPAIYYQNDNEQIQSIIKDILSRGKDVDILSFSKTLADNIVNEKNTGIGQELYERYSEINNCTSGLIANQREGKLNSEIHNRYDNDKCNVGTNFKTGISINKRNHAFVIIMPPKGSTMPFKDFNGIFSNGVNSIIQALARQRKRGGEIHIILPLPDSFDYSSLPFNDELKKKFAKFYDAIKDYSSTKKEVMYLPLHLQNLLLRSFYEDELKGNLLNEIELVKNSDRVDKVRLEFPEFKLFQLNHGEDYLANSFKFFGKDLSAYITYCAITNQFINCNLKGITYKPTLVFQDGFMQSQLQRFYKMYMNVENFNGIYNDASNLYFYLELKNNLFNNYRLKYKNEEEKYTVIKEHQNKKFETQLIGFLQRKLYPNSNFTKTNFYNDRNIVDYDFTRKDYFSFGITHAERLVLEDYSIDEIASKRILAFRSLNYFRKKIIESIQSDSNATRGEFDYVLTTPPSTFIIESEYSRFESMISYFINDDVLIRNSIFEYKQRFKPSFTIKQKIKSFYTKLIEDFFETEDYKKSTPPRRNVKIIKTIHNLPSSEEVLDLVSPAEMLYPDEYWDNHTYEVIDGKLKLIQN